MHSPLWKYAVAAGCLLALTSVTAEAQVCGDADGNGSVTVTDGVQALREAAGLSSSCGTGQCDVDGSGSVSVTDGVNILRKAASLPITENCTGGGAPTPQIERLLSSSLPTFGVLTKIGGGVGAAAGTSEVCENSGGDAFFDDSTGEFVFVNCDTDGVNFDGTIAILEDGFALEIALTDLQTGEVQTLAGQLQGAPSGQNFIVDGGFTFSSSITGAFSVTFEQLVSSPSSAFFVAGSLSYTVTDASLPDVSAISITFNPSTTAQVDVFLVDESVVPFNYDLVSGQLTEIPST